MKASPWDNGSKEPCPRTQRSGHGRIRTEDRLIRTDDPNRGPFDPKSDALTDWPLRLRTWKVGTRDANSENEDI